MTSKTRKPPPAETPEASADPEWEALCRRCGRCCFEKWVDADGTIHETRIPCRYLDIVSRDCKVYEQRLTVGEGCVRLSPSLVASINWLPRDCGYVTTAPLSGESHDHAPGRHPAPSRPDKHPRRRRGRRHD